MAVESVASPQNHWPLRVRAAKPAPQSAIRTIRVGLLGVGQVGQAVARLAADRAATAHAGIRFRIEQALVRDVDKPRRCPMPARITSNPPAFLRGSYDVVVEALDTIEPARTLVARLLGRGTSVVTANKALVAEHGADLQAIAAAHGAAFRFEATALSAVPFLGTLAGRPLVSSVDRVLAIVNGTSNYLLTSLAEPGASFAQAVSRAQELGFAEPDPARDLDGLDSSDKLLLLASLFGWGRLSRPALEVRGIRDITADDLAAARSDGRHHQSGGVGRARCVRRARVRRTRVPARERTFSLAGRCVERHPPGRPPCLEPVFQRPRRRARRDRGDLAR